MSKKRLERILFVVIGTELVAIMAVVGWAALVKPVPTPKITKTPPASTFSVLQPELFAQGLTRPTAIASSSDPKNTQLFVTEQAGTIRSVDAQGKPAAKPLLDIQSRVLNDSSERGLLGLALHPKYAQNGYLFVDYVNKAGNTVIARYSVATQNGTAGTADPASEKIILTITQPAYPNHKGGQLQFGPDGYLYIGMGDGGSGGDPDNRAQNKHELLGKILRIDVDHGDPYAIPASNPFKNDSAAKSEVWAYGLRNPWRFSFDKQTGDLYIGDVGQNKYEEIDHQAASSKGGENYGWRCYEATASYNAAGCQDASKYVMPVLSYDHSDERCSVVGGFVYRGTKYDALRGKYIYGDYCSGQLYYAQQLNGRWQSTQTGDIGSGISTFGQASNGELYVADIGAGTIYHIVDAGHP